MSDLIKRLCRSLAHHLVESELTLQFSEGDTTPWKQEVANAKALIAEAGFDLDVLYPPEDRPTASEADTRLPPDVVRLVKAARIVAFEDHGPEALKELDHASEEFAARVPWEDQPDAEQ